MKITTFVTGIFEENCYVVADDTTGHAAIIDPGADGELLVDAIRALEVAPRAVWITHAHIDHIGAVSDVRSAWNIPVFLHPDDLPLFRAGERQAAAYGIPFEQPPDPDESFADGMKLALGGLAFSVMHAPGHAPGHVVLHGHGVAFVGDCLFAGSVGRTDLPLASGRDLTRSLSRLTALPDDTRVLPGHGPETTIGQERSTNPFLVGLPGRR